MSDTLALEQHFTVAQVAEMWAVSEATVINLFRDQPGVIKLSAPRLLKNRKRRARVTLRIPASVALRLHAEISR